MNEKAMSRLRTMALQNSSSVRILRRSQERTFPYLTEVDGERFVVFRDVFSPTYFESTTPFSRWLCGQRLGRLLEIGCGVGATGVLAVKRGAAASAVLTDINPHAVHNARRNAALHGVTDRVTCLQSDVYAGLPERERFDTIYWNTPFMWRPANYRWKNQLERSLFDPGYKLMERFLSGGRNFLGPDGRLLIGFGDFGSPARFKLLLARSGWRAKCVAHWDRREGQPVQFQIYEARQADG